MGLTEILRIAVNIATPMALLALLALLGFLGYYLYVRHQASVLNALPENQRSQFVDTQLTRYKLAADDLTKQQRYELLHRELDNRTKTSSRNLIVLVIAFVVCFSIAVTGYYLSQQSTPSRVPAPNEFPYTECLTGNDPNLPIEIFGRPDDDIGMPRQWLRLMDSGAPPRLKENEFEVRRSWLLTNAFAAGYADFTAYIYAGTEDKVVIAAFLVQPANAPDTGPALVPLRHLQESERKGVYRFRVPESRKYDRLLVFLAMRQSSFDAILPAQKFRIRSRPV